MQKHAIFFVYAQQHIPRLQLNVVDQLLNQWTGLYFAVKVESIRLGITTFLDIDPLC